MSITQARLISDAELDVQRAHDGLCAAMRKLQAANAIARLPEERFSDLWLDLNGCAGPLDRVLKVGEFTRLGEAPLAS